jgi:hypothetical protein
MINDCHVEIVRASGRSDAAHLLPGELPASYLTFQVHLPRVSRGKRSYLCTSSVARSTRIAWTAVARCERSRMPPL